MAPHHEVTTPEDLRDHIRALDAIGDLKRFASAISADLEAAATTRLTYERRLPAPLFENIQGVAPGFRVLGAPAALCSRPDLPWARVALSIGLPLDASARDVIEHLVAARYRTPLPPVEVSIDHAPVKQNIMRGDDVDLNRFPIPMVHKDDGGKYLNTYGVLIVQTPDGRWTNWSISRVMMVSKDRMTGIVDPSQHIGKVHQEWRELGKPMPFALVQGGPPVVPFVSGIKLPAGADEGSYIGALLGRPLSVIKAESNDLMVPATAEVVMEGRISQEWDTPEGPFGEFGGYAVSHTFLMPSFDIDVITYRDDPIWPLVPEGVPIDEYHTVTGSGQAAEMLATLREAGLPITTVWQPLSSATHTAVVTVPSDWRNQLPGTETRQFVDRIGAALQHCRVADRSPHVFVLDDDVDPADDAELIWAMSTRCHPNERLHTYDVNCFPLMSCWTDADRERGTASMTVHDGLLPAPGQGRDPLSSFAQAYPDDVQQRALESWGLSAD